MKITEQILHGSNPPDFMVFQILEYISWLQKLNKDTYFDVVYSKYSGLVGDVHYSSIY